MVNSKFGKYVAFFVLLSLVSACAGSTNVSTAEVENSLVVESSEVQTGSDETVQSGTSGETEQSGTPVSAQPVVGDYDADDLNTVEQMNGIVDIVLDGDSIEVDGSGAVVDGATVTITNAGAYRLSGSLQDGQVIVDTVDEATVILVLQDVFIQASNGPAIYVRNADKVVITLAEGTENEVSDGTSYALEAEEDGADAAIFSHDDLTINGSGSLTVIANYNHGIASQDDLKVTVGSLTIQSVNDGLRGRDSISIRDGQIQILAGGDGMQSNNDEDPERGFIVIEGGTLEITAALDGIQAETVLTVSGGDLTITTGGGAPATIQGDQGFPGDFQSNNSQSATSSDPSTKGLKAGNGVVLNGGTITVDSLDDSIHSNGSIMIDGATLLLASGDDGLHADADITVSSGEVRVTRSYEGLEASTIEIAGGEIHLVASDDGVNAPGGEGGPMGGGMPGQGVVATGDQSMTISGGYLVVDALGDGLDIGGPITMTGGVVLVVGPVMNGNGALDYMGAFDISGGLLVAVGSSGMAEAPSQTSSQYSYMHNFTSAQAAGTIFRIETEDGQEVLTFEPWREYASVVVSSADLQNGETYRLVVGGESTGSLVDGLYTDGSYAGGSEVTSFTISGMVTTTGEAAGGFGGRPGGQGGRPPN